MFRDVIINLTSSSNSTPGRFLFYLLLNLLLYLLFIFYITRCTLPDFLSVSSLDSLPFLSSYYRTTITTISQAITMIMLWYSEFHRLRDLFKTVRESLLLAEKSFRNLIISIRNQIVFTIFRLIWNETDVRLLFQINRKMVNTL